MEVNLDDQCGWVKYKAVYFANNCLATSLMLLLITDSIFLQ